MQCSFEPTTSAQVKLNLLRTASPGYGHNFLGAPSGRDPNSLGEPRATRPQHHGVHRPWQTGSTHAHVAFAARPPWVPQGPKPREPPPPAARGGHR